MRESAVWNFVNTHKPAWLEIERFEVLHPPGGSDCFWTDTRTGLSGWLELKLCKDDDKEWQAGHIPKLKPEQPMFMRRQAKKGVPAGILMRHGEDHGWYLWTARPYHEWVNDVRSTKARFAPDAFMAHLSMERVIEVLTLSRCAR